MNFWLFKSEQILGHGMTKSKKVKLENTWDGVRNYQASII